MANVCYELKCSDLGTQCDYVEKGYTQDEMMEKAVEHDADVHDHKGGYSDEEMVAINAAVRTNQDC